MCVQYIAARSWEPLAFIGELHSDMVQTVRVNCMLSAFLLAHASSFEFRMLLTACMLCKDLQPTMCRHTCRPLHRYIPMHDHSCIPQSCGKTDVASDLHNLLESIFGLHHLKFWFEIWSRPN